MKKLVFAILATTCAFVLNTSAMAQQPIKSDAPASQSMPGGFADLVETLSPAVVNISTTQTLRANDQPMMAFPFQGLPDDPALQQFKQFFEQFNQMQGQPAEREVNSLGSGFVIDASGYIITNYHVISEADDISVRFTDNTTLKAKVIGKDSKTDLALLKVESAKPLPFVSFGDSDKARVGDWVIAIGNPFGLGGTVTAGIISARQRSINAGPYDDFIQTDASINRGNSGGPLFDTNGKVIGINSAIFSPNGGSIGIGFAIPTSLAEPIIEQLKKFGKTHRGWLGVKIQDVTDEVANSIGMPKAIGALVVEITPDSPAAKAKVEMGDVITHFNGKEITEMRQLPRMVADSKIGEKATLTVWRKNASKELSMTIAEMSEGQEEAMDQPNPASPEKNPVKGSETILGLNVVTLDAKLRASIGLPKDLSGVVIMAAKDGSEAAKRDLKRGDVIAEMNNENITDVAGFKRLTEDAKKAGKNYALLRIVRGKNSAFVTLPLTDKK